MSKSGTVYRTGRTIFLNGEVSRESIGDVINHILTINTEDVNEYSRDVQELVDNAVTEEQENEALELEFNPQRISLLINTNGGTVIDMFALCDVMESNPSQIWTFAVGQICSAGVPIFLAGDKRIIYKNTEVMLHSISGGSQGKMQDIRETTVYLDGLQLRMDKFISERTSITMKKLKEIREKKLDWYITAEEALAFGIATDIMEGK